jgi:hypothetical protein
MCASDEVNLVTWISRQRRQRQTLAGIAVFAFFLSAGASAGAQAPTGTCPPPPPLTPSEGALPSAPSSANLLSPAPEQILVCVGATPITGATFGHWVVVAQKSGGSPSKHRLSAVATVAIVQEVMGFLIASDWVIGEASELHVHVSQSEVRHVFDHIRGYGFHKQREFRSFLKESGQTIADLLFRVRLNLLSTRIQNRVLAGHRGRRNSQRVLRRFVHEFRSNWEAQTYCEPAYDVSDCGHVQASL